MKKASNSDTVKVHYTVKSDDDQIFETSKGRSPLEFEIGSGSVMRRIDEAVLGMQVGDKKAFIVSPEEGYGQRRKDLIATVKKSNFPDHITPAIGQQVQIQLPNGGEVAVTVIDIEGEVVTLDGNHPFAGHTLEFEVEMVDIK